eukprot:2950234-Pyramimonas_sp.AAC.1
MRGTSAAFAVLHRTCMSAAASSGAGGCTSSSVSGKGGCSKSCGGGGPSGAALADETNVLPPASKVRWCRILAIEAPKAR